MRIVLVVRAFPKLSETFIVNQFVGLLQHGWDAHVVCNRSEDREWTRFPDLRTRENTSRVHTVWPDATLPFLMLWLLAFIRCSVRRPRETARYFAVGLRQSGARALREFYLDQEFILLKPDVIHFQFGALAQPRMYLKARLNTRITVSFRGYDLYFVGVDQPGFYKEVWSTADRLHFLGQNVWKRAQQRGCPANKPHTLVPPAIDCTHFKPTPTPTAVSRPLRILSVGRLTWKKGLETALSAVSKLLDAGIDFEYRIVGEGDYLEALTFACYRLGLASHVTFVGALSPADVQVEMNNADIFLHTAVTEGFGNVVLEAQAMQLPVVCSDAGGLTENVIDGETGFVVPRRSACATAERLACLAHNPDMRLRMGAAGRRRVLEQFNLTDQAVAFDAFFASVAHTLND